MAYSIFLTISVQTDINLVKWHFWDLRFTHAKTGNGAWGTPRASTPKGKDLSLSLRPWLDGGRRQTSSAEGVCHPPRRTGARLPWLCLFLGVNSCKSNLVGWPRRGAFLWLPCYWERGCSFPPVVWCWQGKDVESSGAAHGDLCCISTSPVSLGQILPFRKVRLDLCLSCCFALSRRRGGRSLDFQPAPWKQNTLKKKKREAITFFFWWLLCLSSSHITVVLRNVFPKLSRACTHRVALGNIQLTILAATSLTGNLHDLASSLWARLFPAAGLGCNCSLPDNHIILMLDPWGLFPVRRGCKCGRCCGLRGHVPALFLQLGARLRCMALWGRWSRAFPRYLVLHAKYGTVPLPSDGEPRGGIPPRGGEGGLFPVFIICVAVMPRSLRHGTLGFVFHSRQLGEGKHALLKK